MSDLYALPVPSPGQPVEEFRLAEEMRLATAGGPPLTLTPGFPNLANMDEENVRRAGLANLALIGGPVPTRGSQLPGRIVLGGPTQRASAQAS